MESLQPQEQVPTAALQTPAPAPPNDSIQSLIPYKNGKALASYYLGVFGLIPIFGLALSVAAVILGVMGLRYHQAHPEAKGKTHARVGLYLGIFELVVFAIFVVWMIYLAATNPTAST